MKKVFLALFSAALVLCLFATSLSAQSGPRQELGLQFSGLNFDGSNSFSAIYKRQKSDNVYRRLRFAFGNISVAANNNDQSVFNLGGGIGWGKERRKNLGPKTMFFRGFEYQAGFGVSVRSQGNNDSYNANVGLGYVLGLQHTFNEYWAVNVETIPSVAAGFSSSGDDNYVVSLNGGFSNTVSVGVMYRFGG